MDVEEVEVDFRDIHNYHEDKKGKKKPYDFKYCEFFNLTKFTCFCKKKYEKKRSIVSKSIEITNSYMNIIYIIKEFMQLNSVKRVLLSEPQLTLLKYQNKYLNFENPDSTIKYLETLEAEPKLDKEIFDRRKKEERDIDLKMCDGLIDYYNY